MLEICGQGVDILGKLSDPDLAVCPVAGDEQPCCCRGQRRGHPQDQPARTRDQVFRTDTIGIGTASSLGYSRWNRSRQMTEVDGRDAERPLPKQRGGE